MDLLADLNEPQRRAVTHVDGPLLVLAGAGSGKTRVITRRVAWLIHQGIPPWQVLAITFTNKAAEEMRQRVEALDTPRGATICTFHALCARLLREFSAEAALPRNFSIYDRDDQLKMVKEAASRLNLSAENFPPARIHAIISGAKNDLKTPEDFAAGASDFLPRAAAKVYAEYERSLAASGALDFDDLLLRTAFLLRDRPDIREALGRRFRYILIDEYQDTNRAQYVIAHGIAMDHENICATGDPDQSIYAWRGADIRNIMEFEADYPNAVVIRLEENYRSTQPILAAASRLIAHNTMRKEKALWTRRTGGQKVRVAYCDDEHAEASLVAQRIAEHRAAGGDYSDVAVFYRVNSLSRVMEEALLKAGIAYRVARGVEFYNRKEIKDVLAYLKLLVNPADDLSCARIINVPARGIGDTTVKRLAAAAAAHGEPLLMSCRNADRAGLSAAAARKVAAFAAMIGSLSGDLEGSAHEVIERVLIRSGLEEALGGADEEGRQKRANIGELVSAAAEFDRASDGGTLADFLHLVSLVSDADHFEGGAGAVTLMTVHAAKGLEFPVVFIIGCEAGLLPFERQGEWPEQRAAGRDAVRIEEERRLAFVGMTRAMDLLTLTCARRRMIRGRGTPQAVSPFLRELGRESVTVQNLTTPLTSVAERRHRSGGFYADAEERARIEAMYDSSHSQRPGASGRHLPGEEDGWHLSETDIGFPPEYEHLEEGSRIRHPRFGAGKVLRLRQPWPQTRAEILFEQVGPKTIVLSKTTLEIL